MKILTKIYFFFKSFRKDIPQRRVRRWGFSIHELLKDPSGRELFRRYLEREYSIENLLFYEVCNELRYATNKDISIRVNDIYKLVI
jgi:regulator of G-protein signaling